jgi:hypothetical protein
MQRDTFSYLVANPAELTTSDVAYLDELVERFPFCQLGYTLLAKAAAEKVNDETAAQALRKAAAYALSRNALRKLLNGEFPPRLILGHDGTYARRYPRPDDSKAPAVPAPIAQDVDPVQALRGLDYSDVLLAEEEEQVAVHPTSPERPTDPVQARQQEQLSIIDRFIQADSKMGPIRAKRGTEPEVELEDLTAKQPAMGGGLVTEAFAKILEKQGKLDKAIETYEKLGLKFPEKKAYFAEKIEALKK